MFHNTMYCLLEILVTTFLYITTSEGFRVSLSEEEPLDSTTFDLPSPRSARGFQAEEAYGSQHGDVTTRADNQKNTLNVLNTEGCNDLVDTEVDLTSAHHVADSASSDHNNTLSNGFTPYIIPGKVNDSLLSSRTLSIPRTTNVSESNAKSQNDQVIKVQIENFGLYPDVQQLLSSLENYPVHNLDLLTNLKDASPKGLGVYETQDLVKDNNADIPVQVKSDGTVSSSINQLLSALQENVQQEYEENADNPVSSYREGAPSVFGSLGQKIFGAPKKLLHGLTNRSKLTDLLSNAASGGHQGPDFMRTGVSYDQFQNQVHEKSDKQKVPSFDQVPSLSPYGQVQNNDYVSSTLGRSGLQDVFSLPSSVLGQSRASQPSHGQVQARKYDSRRPGGSAGQNLFSLPSTLLGPSTGLLSGFDQNRQLSSAKLNQGNAAFEFPETLLSQVSHLPQLNEAQDYFSRSASPDQEDLYLTPSLAFTSLLNRRGSSLSNSVNIPIPKNLQNVVNARLPVNGGARLPPVYQAMYDLRDVLKFFTALRRPRTAYRQLNPSLPHFQKDYDSLKTQNDHLTKLINPQTQLDEEVSQLEPDYHFKIDNLEKVIAKPYFQVKIPPHNFPAQENIELDEFGPSDLSKLNTQEVTFGRSARVKRMPVLDFAYKLVTDISEPVRQMLPEFAVAVPNLGSLKAESPKMDLKLAKSGIIDLKELANELNEFTGDVKPSIQVKRQITNQESSQLESRTIGLPGGISLNFRPLERLFPNKQTTVKQKEEEEVLKESDLKMDLTEYHNNTELTDIKIPEQTSTQPRAISSIIETTTEILEEILIEILNGSDTTESTTAVIENESTEATTDTGETDFLGAVNLPSNLGNDDTLSESLDSRTVWQEKTGTLDTSHERVRRSYYGYGCGACNNKREKPQSQWRPAITQQETALLRLLVGAYYNQLFSTREPTKYLTLEYNTENYRKSNDSDTETTKNYADVETTPENANTETISRKADVETTTVETIVETTTDFEMTTEEADVETTTEYAVVEMTTDYESIKTTTDSNIDDETTVDNALGTETNSEKQMRMNDVTVRKDTGLDLTAIGGDSQSIQATRENNQVSNVETTHDLTQEQPTIYLTSGNPRNVTVTHSNNIATGSHGSGLVDDLQPETFKFNHHYEVTNQYPSSEVAEHSKNEREHKGDLDFTQYDNKVSKVPPEYLDLKITQYNHTTANYPWEHAVRNSKLPNYKGNIEVLYHTLHPTIELHPGSKHHTSYYGVPKETKYTQRKVNLPHNYEVLSAQPGYGVNVLGYPGTQYYTRKDVGRIIRRPWSKLYYAPRATEYELPQLQVEENDYLNHPSMQYVLWRSHSGVPRYQQYQKRSKRFLPRINTQISLLSDLQGKTNFGNALNLGSKVSSQSPSQVRGSKRVRFGVRTIRSLPVNNQIFRRDFRRSYGIPVAQTNYGYTGQAKYGYTGEIVGKNAYGPNGELLQIVDLSRDSSVTHPVVAQELDPELLEVLGVLIQKYNDSKIPTDGSASASTLTNAMSKDQVKHEDTRNTEILSTPERYTNVGSETLTEGTTATLRNDKSKDEINDGVTIDNNLHPTDIGNPHLDLTQRIINIKREHTEATDLTSEKTDSDFENAEIKPHNLEITGVDHPEIEVKEGPIGNLIIETLHSTGDNAKVNATNVDLIDQNPRKDVADIEHSQLHQVGTHSLAVTGVDHPIYDVKEGNSRNLVLETIHSNGVNSNIDALNVRVIEPYPRRDVAEQEHSSQLEQFGTHYLEETGVGHPEFDVQEGQSGKFILENPRMDVAEVEHSGQLEQVGTHNLEVTRLDHPEYNVKEGHSGNLILETSQVIEPRPRKDVAEVERSSQLGTAGNLKVAHYTEIQESTGQQPSVNAVELVNQPEDTGDLKIFFHADDSNPPSIVQQYSFQPETNLELTHNIEGLKVTGQDPVVAAEQTGRIEVTHHTDDEDLTGQLPEVDVVGEHTHNVELTHEAGALDVTGDLPKVDVSEVHSTTLEIKHHKDLEATAKLPKVEIAGESDNSHQTGSLDVTRQFPKVNVAGENRGRTGVSHDNRVTGRQPKLSVNGGLPGLLELNGELNIRHEPFGNVEFIRYNQRGPTRYFDLPAGAVNPLGLFRFPQNLDVSLNPFGNLVPGGLTNILSGDILRHPAEKVARNNLRSGFNIKVARGHSFLPEGDRGYNLLARDDGGGIDEKLENRVVGSQRTRSSTEKLSLS